MLHSDSSKAKQGIARAIPNKIIYNTVTETLQPECKLLRYQSLARQD